jgi:hypothetical protein
MSTNLMKYIYIKITGINHVRYNIQPNRRAFVA